MTKKQRLGLLIIVAPVYTLFGIESDPIMMIICLVFWIVGNFLFIGLEDEDDD